VGHETLSAEQIYVDHAIEQAKGVLAACGAPDSADLSSQEVIIEEDSASDAGRRLHHGSATATEEEQVSSPIIALGEEASLAEKIAPIAVNMLDLSDPVAEPEPKKSICSGAKTKEPSEGMSDIDLLDFGETPAKEVIPSASKNMLTQSHDALGEESQVCGDRQADLQNILEPTIRKEAYAGASNGSRHLVDVDMIDFEPLPVAQVY